MRARSAFRGRTALYAAALAMSCSGALLGVALSGAVRRVPLATPEAMAAALPLPSPLPLPLRSQEPEPAASPLRSPEPEPAASPLRSPEPPLARPFRDPPWSGAIAAGHQTLLQKGGSDLFLWVHIGSTLIKEHVAETTGDAVATEFWGIGTNAYRPLLLGYGGFGGWVDGIARRSGRREGFRRTCLTTWSAGSQVLKDVCSGADWPDAIVSLDGLYGEKPAGARPGDGRVVWDAGLEGVTRCAVAAARGERIFVLLHSSIQTPFASSREVAEELRRRVELEVGASMHDDATLGPEDLDGHAFERALELGDLHIISFPGDDRREHVVQAHLYDEVWRRWIPWTQDDEAPSAGALRPEPPALAQRR